MYMILVYYNKYLSILSILIFYLDIITRLR